MAKNSDLLFVIDERDLESLCLWLDQEYFAYSFEHKNFGRVMVKIDVGFDPGKAGRCFDIGLALGRIEKKIPKSKI